MKHTQEELQAIVGTREANAEARAYLKSTDWFLLRELDGGVAMTSEVKQLRVDARASIK